MDKKIQMREKLSKVLAGKGTEQEKRSFEHGVNGILVPKEVHQDFLGKSESPNLLRKYGTIIEGNARLELPVITKDIEVVAHTEEYKPGETIDVNSLELNAEYLSPIEFDAEIRVARRYLQKNPKNAESIIKNLEKAYFRAEIEYMYNGTNPKALNRGSLYNRAKVVNFVSTDPIEMLKEIRDSASTSVQNNSRWIINGDALKFSENLILPNGEPALKTLDHISSDGAKYMLLGFPCDVTDDIRSSTEGSKLFYFGDISSFFIYEDPSDFEIVTLYDTYADMNEFGFKVYHLVDGKLVYSELETTIFKAEIQ